MTSSTETPELEAMLLPFFANGTLGSRERARVEQYLGRSASAREELAFLNMLRSSLPELPLVAPPTKAERARILRGAVAGASADPARTRMAYALAALLALAVLEAAALWRVSSSSSGWGEVSSGAPAQGGPYRPAGGAASAQLTVRFREDASEREIRALLVARELLIVSGPTALGSYTLELSSTDPDEQTLQSEIETLRGASIVSYVGLP